MIRDEIKLCNTNFSLILTNDDEIVLASCWLQHNLVSNEIKTFNGTRCIEAYIFGKSGKTFTYSLNDDYYDVKNFLDKWSHINEQ